MSTFLPDVNVLVALMLRNHTHTVAANRWYEQEQGPVLQICRLTQLSFLRRLTTEAIAGVEVLSNDAAWEICRNLLARGNIAFNQEPDGMKESLGTYARRNMSVPKLWADPYLASFAIAAGFKLVTFDRALAKRRREALHCEVRPIPYKLMNRHLRKSKAA